MTHEEALALLEAYVDDQLTVSDVLRVEVHVAECERCRIWLQDRRALIARIRSTPLRYSLPPEVERAIRRPLTPERLGTTRPWWTQALAAGVVTGLLGLWVGHSLPQRPDQGDEWVSAHVRSTLSAHSVDVLSSSHHTVKPWLSSKLPFSPPVPELDGQGDLLLGARTDYINRMAVAALRYQHGNHQIDVFVWPSSQGPAPRASVTPIEGFRLATAQVPGFNAVVVSDMSASELDAFRDRWKERAAAP
jgi:anti-sigma factor RsiW